MSLPREKNFSIRPKAGGFEVCWSSIFTGDSPVGTRLFKKGTGGFKYPECGVIYPTVDSAVVAMKEWQTFWDAQSKAMRK